MIARVSSVLFNSSKPKLNVPSLDVWLLSTVALMLCLGLVMMSSASISVGERMHAEPFYFLTRQLSFLLIAFLSAAVLFRIPLDLLNKLGPIALLLGIFLLLLVLVPNVGKTVNGSTRWISLGVFNFQISELVKVLMVVFMASYLTRQGERLRNHFSGMMIPLVAIGIVGVLLLLEPDFGTTVVILSFCLGLMLLAGMRLGHFLGVLMLAGLAMLALAKAAPYRWERVTGFLNPWADPFDSGFQLSQSLIAFGRGELFGVGLGGSVQKLFYLPEAHTDFLYAVLAEELGFIGALAVIALFAIFMWRTIVIAREAQQRGEIFGGYLSMGVGLWFVFQAYVNMGVNMGVLPTKGLTLPLMSYGGSSLIVSVLAITLVLRVDYENRLAQQAAMKSGAKS
jgi:cell division protein FtsW